LTLLGHDRETNIEIKSTAPGQFKAERLLWRVLRLYGNEVTAYEDQFRGVVEIDWSMVQGISSD